MDACTFEIEKQQLRKIIESIPKCFTKDRFLRGYVESKKVILRCLHRLAYINITSAFISIYAEEKIYLSDHSTEAANVSICFLLLELFMRTTYPYLEHYLRASSKS